MALVRFQPLGFAVAAMALGLLLAWLAAAVQATWAPVLLFPLLLGALLGGGVLAMGRQWRAATRGVLVTAAVLGCAILNAGQHYFAFRVYRTNYERSLAKNPQAMLVKGFEPMSFAEFLDYSARHRSYGIWQLHGGMAWASWGVDAVLVMAAAVGLVWWGYHGGERAKPKAAGNT